MPCKPGVAGSIPGFSIKKKKKKKRPNLITWVVGFSPNLISWAVVIYSFAKLKKMDFTCH